MAIISNKSVFIDCLYQEPEIATYQGFKISWKKDDKYESKTFKGKNPKKDYQKVKNWVLDNVDLKSCVIMEMSSLDHFCLDGGEIS